MISALTSGERVSLLVDDEATEKRVKQLLPSLNNVSFYRIKSADVWMRDYGPIFVRREKGIVASTKWKFNAWGKKYDNLLSDNETGLEIARIASTDVFTPDMVTRRRIHRLQRVTRTAHDGAVPSKQEQKSELFQARDSRPLGGLPGH